MYEQNLHQEAVINAPIQKVFDFLVDPMKIPLVMPGLVDNSDVSEMPLKEGSTFHYRFQMFGVLLEGTWRVTKLEGINTYEAVTDGDDRSEWKYKLEEVDGSTKVTMDLNYDIPKSVIEKIEAKLMDKINEDNAELYFKNLKTVLEM